MKKAQRDRIKDREKRTAKRAEVNENARIFARDIEKYITSRGNVQIMAFAMDRSTSETALTLFSFMEDPEEKLAGGELMFRVWSFLHNGQPCEAMSLDL